MNVIFTVWFVCHVYIAMLRVIDDVVFSIMFDVKLVVRIMLWLPCKLS